MTASTFDGPKGDVYQARFDALAESGKDMHGEVAFLTRLDPPPTRVLDAGCGTGRVAIELDRRGVAAAGIDVDPAMLQTARERAPHLTWETVDLTTDPIRESLSGAFDVVVMAGNVLLFVPPGTQAAAVRNCASALGEGGRLVAGFSLRDPRSSASRYSLIEYDRHCADVGLVLVDRFATWDGAPWTPDDDYAVSVHRASTTATTTTTSQASAQTQTQTST